MVQRALRFCFVAGVLLAPFFLAAVSRAKESPDGLWTLRADNAPPQAGDQPWWFPRSFVSAELDTGKLDQDLASAAFEGPFADVRTQGAEITLPLPDGSFQRFALLARPVAAALRNASPGLSVYGGVGLDDPDAVVSCTRSVLGFQCMIRFPQRVCYVDPLWRGNDRIHAVYDFAENSANSFACHCETAAEHLSHGGAPAGGGAGLAGLVSTGGTRREFRLAIATTGEYWQFWGSNAATTAGIMGTITNVNAVLENDATMRLNLVATVLNTDPGTDPYPGAGLNAQVQIDLDANVGSANYDLGHLFHGTPAGSINGNAGCIGCICNDPNKGSGFSDGGNTPTGGNMDFLVLHEMGHQLGGRHSWAASSCGAGQYDMQASVEPGTGSTIMSYSSICGAADNLLGGAVGNLYYHADSIDRIVGVTSGAACRVDVATGNAAPSVTAPGDVTIPMGTPFLLQATGSDPDGDPLTYCWEQMDPSDMQYPLNAADSGSNPLFRSFPPVISDVRWFPNLPDVLAGNFFPGTLGEQLPSTARTMNFWITARDNTPNAGGVDQDAMTVTSDIGSGPFQVLFPNGGEMLPVNVPLMVTWDVAGTDGAPVSEPNVVIELSLDGGMTRTVLATTANDGSHMVTFDCTQLSTQARIFVFAASNPMAAFYDVSDSDFAIEDVTPPVVTCMLQRGILWPASRGLLPMGFGWSVVPDDCDPNPTETMSVYSTEGDGAAPYAPDWLFAPASNLRLRAERVFPGPGRVYIVVVNSTDSSGNRGADCCTAIVPAFPTATNLMALQATAAAARAACLLSLTDVAPPGFGALAGSTGVALP